MESTAKGRDGALRPDVPEGLLRAYRARASFSSEELLLFWDGPDILHLKVRSTGSLTMSSFPHGSGFEVLKPSGLPGPDSSVGWV